MEWHDRAIVLGVRPHGEASVIASLLTTGHGRHAGLVRGGRSRRHAGVLQTGNIVAARWRARLPDHLGTFVIEPEEAVASALLGDPMRLACLASACALAERTLADRLPCEALFNATEMLVRQLRLGVSHWDAAYVRWELGLLNVLGYGLDLKRCALTGSTEELVWVSPRSGRAVSAAAGEPWKGKLLDLPGFLVGAPEARAADVLAGLRLSGYFLERHALAGEPTGLPPARQRFVDLLSGQSTICSGNLDS
ncbi:MAG: DNA repair protein RecO [bacterium]|nr:DNA repair protein RecO [bacterium]MDE0240226.1 DNA repair protein RecO [bacterium]MDE0418356.1 DNA repair protein RecO [bacterium]